MDGKVIVVGGKLPAAVLLFAQRGLIGEELAEDFTLVGGGRLVLIVDDDAVVPTAVFGGVEAGAKDGVAGDVAELLLAVEGGDLIFAEDIPSFALIAIFDVIDPFDLIGRIGRTRHKHGAQNDTSRQQNGKKFRTHHLPLNI